MYSTISLHGLPWHLGFLQYIILALSALSIFLSVCLSVYYGLLYDVMLDHLNKWRKSRGGDPYVPNVLKENFKGKLVASLVGIAVLYGAGCFSNSHTNWALWVILTYSLGRVLRALVLDGQPNVSNDRAPFDLVSHLRNAVVSNILYLLAGFYTGGLPPLAW
jgi:ABC-type multidrug transport system fused ATPase/permease subunit